MKFLAKLDALVSSSLEISFRRKKVYAVHNFLDQNS